RLSLSLKRVEDGEAVRGPIGEAAPALGLSEEVFTEPSADEAPAEEADASIEADDVAPESPGPGDSEGAAPASPDDDEA
ncbi:MAG: hypothetical protein ACRDOG_10460, partial [Gaiellaceae bacterium]